MNIFLDSIKSFFSRNLHFVVILAGTFLQLTFLYFSYFNNNFLFLLTNTLPDDAFYYFQTARNIVNGYGSTFDGVNLANGYHPLWMLVLLPIYKFFSAGGVNDVTPIYAALSLAVLFSGASAYFVYRIMLEYTENNKIISLGIFIYLFNPYLLYNVLNGLETSLLLLVLSVFIYSLILASKNESKKNLLQLGFVGGLLTLCRLDMTVVVAVSFTYFLYKHYAQNLKKGVNSFFTVSLSSLIIFFTWMIYNLKTFGMYLTSASLTSTFINHRLTYSDNGGESLKLFLKTIVYMLERATQQIVENTGAPIILTMILGVGIFFVFKNSVFGLDGVWNKRLLKPILFVTAGLFALVFVSAGLRWTFRSWYFIPLLVPFTVYIVWVINQVWLEFGLDHKKMIGNIFLLVFAGFISFSYFVSWTKNLSQAETLQQTMYEATLWQNENLGPNVHVGVFNAGLQAYFSNHKVTNLDGLINNNASKAMMNNTLWEYITETEHIDYIADFDSYMTYRYKDSFRDKEGNLLDITSSTTMEKVFTIKGLKDLNIYKIKY